MDEDAAGRSVALQEAENFYPGREKKNVVLAWERREASSPPPLPAFPQHPFFFVPFCRGRREKRCERERRDSAKKWQISAPSDQACTSLLLPLSPLLPEPAEEDSSCLLLLFHEGKGCGKWDEEKRKMKKKKRTFFFGGRKRKKEGG